MEEKNKTAQSYEKKRRTAEYLCDGSSPDDIVISGMSGRFPSADNIGELMEALYGKKDLTRSTDDRWEKGVNGLPDFAAHVKDLTKFDAAFFGLSNAVVNCMDPQQRLMLEVCYEAVADSGYDPSELRRKNIGVYIGCSHSDAFNILKQSYAPTDRHSMMGCSQCFVANRVSWVFDFHGPSFSVDSGCSSSSVALSAAVNDLKEGQCEAAIVGGAQICLDPNVTYGYIIGGICSKTGRCRPYDASADGMSRSECVAAILIQKASVARRNYATIVHVKTKSSGYVAEGIYHPSLQNEVELLHETFKECGLNPLSINYVESHGTGTAVGDPVELNAIVDVFCKGRKNPLLVGTVKSNIGHPEASSAVCGIIKSIMALETGMIAPNLYYSKPNPNCSALLNGSIKIVTEPTPLIGSYVPINSFGIGGTNSHIILKGNSLEYKKCENGFKSLPQLVLFSSTTKQAVKYVFDYIENQSLQREFFALLHNLSFSSPTFKPYRGYCLLSKEISPESNIKQAPVKNPELWFVLTGMGCQWPGMGLTLMQIDVFAESIKRSAEVLKPYGINLLECLRPERADLQQDRKITAAFVTITAIQIALIDLLNELEIFPDGIIGHSTGELLCAYADGCCSAEQTILSAYWRGKAVESANLPQGAMAAIGLTWEEAIQRCPDGVYAACHNAQDSVTISGLKEDVEKFVDELKKENIFARVVNAYGYAFHCPLLKPAAKILESNLEKIIKHPKPKTKRWISTSYPPSEWNKPEANVADASYFIHNLMSTVRFHEALTHIPSNAVTIEIGPHHLLQSILKRVLGVNATNFGLMKRHENNVNFLLSTIGQLYTLGFNPKIENLYPPVQYPVPRNTPIISNLIKWNHSVSWSVPKYTNYNNGTSVKALRLDTSDSYLLDHCIEGRSLFPATGYILLAWEAMAVMVNKSISELPVVIENFKIHRATILNSNDKKQFSVSMLNVGGDFEITESKFVVATGKIISSSEPLLKMKLQKYQKLDSSKILSGRDIYNELKIHGYEYGPAFQGILEADIDGTQGLLKWTDKWIPYLDAHLLFFGLLYSNEEFTLPTGALSFKIDPTEVINTVTASFDEGLKGVPVFYDEYQRKCSSGGIEIKRLKLEPAPHRSAMDGIPVLENYLFVPYADQSSIQKNNKQMLEKYIQVCNEMAKKVAQSLSNATSNTSEVEWDSDVQQKDFEMFFKNDECILLTIFKDILEIKTKERFFESKKDIFAKFIKNIGKDILYKTLTKEYPFRTILDIVTENTTGILKIIELADGYSPLSPIMHDMLKKYCRAKFHCTLYHPDPEDLDQDCLIQRNISIKTMWSSKKPTISEKYGLVTGTFLFGNLDMLELYVQTLSALVHENGFVLLLHKCHFTPSEVFICSLCNEELEVQSTDVLEKILKIENLIIVSKKSDALGSTLYLLRRVPQNSFFNAVVKITSNNYKKWVNNLKYEIKNVENNNMARVWLVAEDSPVNGIIGLVNCLHKEPGGEKIRCVFICQDTESSLANPPNFNLKDSFYSEIIRKDLFMNVYKNSTWGSFQHLSLNINLQAKAVEHSFLNSIKYGDLSALRWMESSVKYNQGFNSEEVLIHIYYSSLNFRDVLFATGRLSLGVVRDCWGKDTCSLGIEFAGKTSTGRRVMGATKCRAIATTLLCSSSDLIFDVPDHWTLEEAATVPIVYSTCYYAFFVRGLLKKGETVLIHSGTGGIGTAAIRIAFSLNCEIFTTVGTKEKMMYLKKMFPSINPENIGFSRDTTFEDLIMTRTKGRGVDVILNSLADDKFYASTRCLARHGRFLEIGKYDMSMDHFLGLSMFLANTSFHSIQFDYIFADEIVLKNVKQQILSYMKEGIRSGVVQPLNRTVFLSKEAENAFRYMASGKHIGKVVLKIRDEEPAKISPPLKLLATPCLYFYRSKVYIIIGGLGGFGIELTKWMIEKGAHNIVLTSRYGARTPYHHFCLKRWKKYCVNVQVSTLNVEKRSEAQTLLKESSHIGPIGGIFNSAVVLKDAFIENQSTSNFEEVCAPKACATKNLDELSRTLCPDLDYFVCFSSISCGKGNAGQSNYGYANSVMERICEKRRSENLHGLAIQWGIIGDVGIVHRHMGEDAMIAGVVSQKVKSCLATLEKLLLQENPVVSSFITADNLKKKVNQNDLIPQLAKIFGLNDPSELNLNRTFLEIGMDSIIAVEINHLIVNNYNVSLNLKDIQNMKVDDLRIMLEGKEIKNLTKTENEDSVITDFVFPKFLIPEVSITALNTKSSGFPMFILYSGETDMNKLQMLVNDIHCPVYGISYTKQTPTDSIKSAAMWYLKEIHTWKGNNVIHLVGYSSYSALAIEMALQSQNSHGNLPQIQTLILLEGALSLVDSLNAINEYSDEEMLHNECSNLYNFVLQFSKTDLTQFKNELESEKTLDLRISCAVNLLAGSCSEAINKSDLYDAINLYIRMQNLMQKYSAEEKLEKKLIVIEPSRKLLSNDVSLVKGTLSKICKGDIFIHRIPGGEDFLSENETVLRVSSLFNQLVK